jgi:8-amino-7-oxononanoate synthase
MDWIAQELLKLDSEGLRRRVRSRSTGVGRAAATAAKALLDFSSNDYLALARDPRVKERAEQALARDGSSASASRLMSGALAVHDELEQALAALVGKEASLLFGSGYAMNLGVLSALAGRDDAVFADRLVHASLIDGARLSGAALKRFAHNDAASLERLLRETPVRGHRFVVCESVYSMDGDLAPLSALGALARSYKAIFVVDEAHALGVFGGGRGLCHALPAEVAPDLVLGTLGKALGSFGGFAAGNAGLRELLVNRARSFIFSTALPPASAAAALAAVEIVLREPGLGADLLRRAASLSAQLGAAGLPVPGALSQILPVAAGDNRLALNLAERLEEQGILAVAIRPPTVPPGTARLRLSVTLAHSSEDLAFAARSIAEAARELGVP